MIVKVADYIGTNATTVDQGETIYNLIKDINDITLDFEGITLVGTPFANFAVGRLLEHRTLKEFNEQVKIVNLEDDWEYDFFKLVVKNADRYYRDEKYRLAVDEIIKEMSQEDYDWHQ
jgi:hypothetical protein